MSPNESECNDPLEQYALLADLARPLVHEFNNFLNSLLLHLAVLQARMANADFDDLATLGKEANRIARYLHEWQKLPRSLLEGHLKLVNLNQVVKDGLAKVGNHAASTHGFSLALAADPLQVRTSVTLLCRLCSLLLQASAKVIDHKGIHVATERREGHAVLTLHIDGPNWSQAMLESAFHLSSESSLELAACHGLAERLRARLEVENHPAGGPIIRLIVPD